MAGSPGSTRNKRTPLSRERVLEAAMLLADLDGIEPLTIRKLAAELGVKPMAIYHHVASKDEILDGMVDCVFAEIELPPEDLAWSDAVRVRSISAREALGRHPWATPMMESRTSPGPATLRQHDAMLGCLRRGGLSLEMAAHAYALIDSFVYGFALQEASLPGGGGGGGGGGASASASASADDGDGGSGDGDGRGEIVELAADLVDAMSPEQYPHLVEFTTGHVMQPGYSFADTFEFGLDLLLGGLEAARVSDSPDTPSD